MPGVHRDAVTHYPEKHKGEWIKQPWQEAGAADWKYWRRCASTIAKVVGDESVWVFFEEIDEKTPNCLACIALGPSW